jgi:hypothetical protein
MIHSCAPVATAIEDRSEPSDSDVTSEDALAVISTKVTDAAPLGAIALDTSGAMTFAFENAIITSGNIASDAETL